MNSYLIYKLCDEDCNRKWYLRDGVSPEEQDNPLNGVGYLGYNKDRLPNPYELIVVIGEASAIKLCEMLKHAFYGSPEQHFYEEIK